MSAPAGPVWIDAAAIARVPWRVGVDALERALQAGLDPERDVPRTSLPLPGGQLLVMPAATPAAIGVKLISVAPDNPARGAPRIQGAYLLFDTATLAPRALCDGAALTLLRTPAVSALALRHLARAGSSRLALFGTGPEAWAHLEAVRATFPIARVAVAGRDDERLAAFLGRCRDAGVAAEPMSRAALATADIVCCCTSARTPLFAGDEVAAHAAVVAIGSHEPDARELDAALLARADVVVDGRAAALREAGDVLQAIAEGACHEARLIGLGPLVRGEARLHDDRPRVFKSVGMSWQDAIVAAAVVAYVA